MSCGDGVSAPFRETISCRCRKRRWNLCKNRYRIHSFTQLNSCKWKIIRYKIQNWYRYSGTWMGTEPNMQFKQSATKNTPMSPSLSIRVCHIVAVRCAAAEHEHACTLFCLLPLCKRYVDFSRYFVHVTVFRFPRQIFRQSTLYYNFVSSRCLQHLPLRRDWAANCHNYHLRCRINANIYEDYDKRVSIWPISYSFCICQGGVAANCRKTIENQSNELSWFMTTISNVIIAVCIVRGSVPQPESVVFTEEGHFPCAFAYKHTKRISKEMCTWQGEQCRINFVAAILHISSGCLSFTKLTASFSTHGSEQKRRMLA